MIKAIADTRHMTVRHVMELLRQPWWIFVNLVQPVIWLLLFGALFETVTDIPGFGSDNYIQFLAPGVVVMTAFFTAGWSGMPMIEDLERGVVDRFLVSPVRRSSLITGRLAQASLQIVIQTLIIVGLAILAGAEFSNGVAGVAVLIGIAILVGAAFGALSNGLALLARREETLIALMQFLMLPLSFLSVTFMQKDLMPDWMQSLLKAYADALRPFLTLGSDLTRPKKAMFVASPMQYGIPTGYDPSEFINEALFKIADGTQSGDSPSFRLGGPNFFSTLNRY